jgi:hypothetical protein
MLMSINSTGFNRYLDGGMLEVFANNGEASVTTTHSKATLLNASIDITSPSLLRRGSGGGGGGGAARASDTPPVGVAMTAWAMQPSIE